METRWKFQGLTRDVFVDDVLEGDDVSKFEGYTSSSVTHISFAADSDGRGDFFVDNVFAPAVDRHRLNVTIVGNGMVEVTPGESTYADGSVVDCRWVYTIKYKPNRSMDKYKPRLVAHGFT